MMYNNHLLSGMLLWGLLLPFSALAQYNPIFLQNGTTNTTLAEVKTDSAQSGTATFILLGDGRFRLGEGASISRSHNYPQRNTSYTSTSYFVRKYKDDPPTARSATVVTGSGVSSVTNPDVQMTACTKIGTSWFPVAGKNHFTILSFTNTCSDTSVSGTIKFYYTNQQHFSTGTGDLLIYNSWISSPMITTSDDSQYDFMLVANYSNLAKGEIRHIYLNGSVDNSVSVGTALKSKLKITGISCGTTECSASIDTQKYPHDPNEKTVDKETVCSFNMMPHELGYKITFQNDGQNYADTITVSDLIEPKLLWPTVQLVQSSALCMHTLGPVSKFRFPGIQLPGLNQTTPHLFTYDETVGWFTFNVQTITCLHPYEVILNQASVVFDMQLPVLTTKAKTTVTEASCGFNNCSAPRADATPADMHPISGILATPNPVQDHLSVTFSTQGAWQLSLYSMQGQALYQQSGDVGQGQQNIAIETGNWAPGVYILHWHDGQASQSTRIIKQ